jgi:hypothetical protein
MIIVHLANLHQLNLSDMKHINWRTIIAHLLLIKLINLIYKTLQLYYLTVCKIYLLY